MSNLSNSNQRSPEVPGNSGHADSQLSGVTAAQSVQPTEALAMLSPEAFHFMQSFARLASQGGSYSDLNFSLRSNDPAIALELQRAGFMTALERGLYDSQRGAIYRDIQPTDGGKTEIKALMRKINDQESQMARMDSSTALAVLKLASLRQHIYIEPEINKTILRNSISVHETAEGNLRVVEGMDLLSINHSMFQPSRVYTFDPSGKFINSELSNDVLNRDCPVVISQDDAANRVNQILWLAKSAVQDLLDDPAAAQRLADFRKLQEARRNSPPEDGDDFPEQDDRDQDDEEVHEVEDVANWIGPKGTWT